MVANAVTPVNRADSPLAWGMYGFALLGMEDPGALLRPVPADWPQLAVRQERAGPEHRIPDGTAVGVMRIEDDLAEVWVSERESLTLERASMEVRLTTREPVSDDALAHPYLGLPAAVANRWIGRQVIHAGAFLHAGSGWAVLGTKEAGKSSTLGWLQQRDVTVLSDDLLVTEGTTMFAGPRCVDLRDETAALLGGRDVGVLGGRRRWRLEAGEAAAACPLGGLVHLAWGDEVALDPLGPADRLTAMFEHVVFGPDNVDLTVYLDLAGLPAWRFVRPRSLDGFDRAIDQLLAAVS